MKNAPIDTPTDAPPTLVLCVDDIPDMTLVMRMMIDREPTMRCVGCLASADDLLDHIRDLHPPPDVLLLDATMDGKDPLVVMRELARKFPAIKTIVYSGKDDRNFVARAKDNGARGFVSKGDEPDTILRAVREVAAGNEWFPGSGC